MNHLNKKIIVGIDASNIGGGGGLTHLIEILKNFEYSYFKNKITKIIIFSSTKVLKEIPDLIFVEKITFPEFNKTLFDRFRFQLFSFDKEIKSRCDILLSITGDYTGSFKPVVGMSRNMLLYEKDVWKDIKQPKELLRFWINFNKQKICFKNASTIIFISQYAKNFISQKLNLRKKVSAVIHHGISIKFLNFEKKQKDILNYSFNKPFRLLYVSTIHIYKNHLSVVKALSRARKMQIPVELVLVGGVLYEPAGKRLFNLIKKVDPEQEFIFYKGHINYAEIEKEYQLADGIIFASTCENMPNILIESMASGNAILCSNKQPMPEFIKENAFYFDAKSVESILESLLIFLAQPQKRKLFINNNKNEVKNYSWTKSSSQLFKTILNTYKHFKNV